MTSSILVEIACEKCEAGITLYGHDAVQFVKRYSKAGRIKGTSTSDNEEDGWYHARSGNDYCPRCWLV